MRWPRRWPRGWPRPRSKHRSATTPAPAFGSPLGQWTNGSNLKTKAATGVLIAALVLSPAGLVVGIAGASSGSAPTTTSAPAELRGEQAAVEEFAARFVATWLTSNADNAEDRLAGMIKIPDSAEFPTTARRATDPATADVVRVDDGIWSVTVAVTTTTPSAPSRRVRRYFAVPVVYTAGRVAAMALPSPTAAPTMAEPQTSNYPGDLGSGHPAWRTVAGFMAALLAAKGDITRYLTPGTRVAPVTPAPFAAVRIRQIAVSADVGVEPARVPAEGEELAVLVTASGRSAQTGTGGLSVQYALVLTGRDGRWEVTEVEDAPRIEDRLGDGSGEPSPDGSSAEEEQ